MTALALPAACAVELIHTYSLVHDDLPAMDNDTLRRGRPTAHVVFGEGMAILSGDGLLTEAFALLAREPAALPAGASVTAAELAGRRLRALGIIADAAGAAGMVGGQAIDLQAAAPGASPLEAEALQGDARAQDRRAHPRFRAGGRDSGRRVDTQKKPLSTPTGAHSGSPFRSSTTSSTSKGRRPISARQPERTPPPASRPIPRSSA